VKIDGWTEDEASSNPPIVLIGFNGSTGQAAYDGLTITAPNCVIDGLTINRFTNGITIEGSGATGNVVSSDYIGTSQAGTHAEANVQNGVWINGAANNFIGTIVNPPGPFGWNLISGNKGSGILISGSGATGNTVQNNIIGMNVNGNAAISNADGVTINQGANHNIIGGTAGFGLENWISGNSNEGVLISDQFTSNNVVLGNLIGTDGSGSTYIRNGDCGVLIINGASNNTVGGTATAAGNVISGNFNQGVALSGPGTTGNVILGNLIGLDWTGTTGLANKYYGIIINGGASGNTISGAATGAGNYISGNARDGVLISDSTTTGNILLNNTIGLNQPAPGSPPAAVPNTYNGVEIANGANGNTVGAGNVISGNTLSGVYITGSGTSGNVVQGCIIGTTASNTTNVGNKNAGVDIDGASQNTIGGTVAAARNIISENGSNGNKPGVLIINSGATGNSVEGNTIGLGVDGTTALPNFGNGVLLGSGANNDTIGMTASGGGAGNLIGANGLDSVLVSGGINDPILSNSILETATGTNGILLTSNGNHLQPAPVLTSALTSGSTTTVTASMIGVANTSFLLQFFASAAGSPPKGQTLLGQLTVTTGTNGQVNFTTPPLAAPGSGQLVTATATRSDTSDTSEFSSAVSIGQAPAVTLTGPANSSSVNTATPTFHGAAGTASGNLNTVTVKVYSGSTASGTVVETLTAMASGGTWSVAASPALAQGTYTAQAQQSNTAGNIGYSSANTFIVDTTAPVVTLTAPANNTSTNNTTPSFHGAAGTASGDLPTVTVKVYSGSTPSGTVVETLTAMASSGTWSVAASSALAQGTYTAQAQQADAAGNTGFSSANTFIIDTTAPTVTLTAPANDSSTNNTTPTFSGAAGTALGDSNTITVKVYSGSTASGTVVQTLTTTATAVPGRWVHRRR
jgi:hypothetical protein